MLKVLILDYIEQAELLDKFIREKFSNVGLQIWYTEDLEEFLIILKKHISEIDLLMIDKSRSIGEEENIVEYFRIENKTASIFYLTSWGETDELLRMKRAGLITAIFIKPCDLEKLYQETKIIFSNQLNEKKHTEETFEENKPEFSKREYQPIQKTKSDFADPLTINSDYEYEKPKNKFQSGFKSLFSSVGGLLLYVVGCLAFLIIGLFFIMGGVWLSSKILSWMSNILWIIFMINIIMIPIAFFKESRKFYGSVLFISSYFYGITLWTWSFLLSYQIWGIIGLIIGILIMGVGVVPIAIIGLIVEDQWTTVLTLIVFIVITFGSRMLGIVFTEDKDSI